MKNSIIVTILATLATTGIVAYTVYSADEVLSPEEEMIIDEFPIGTSTMEIARTPEEKNNDEVLSRLNAIYQLVKLRCGKE
jgi:hypothetical protein